MRLRRRKKEQRGIRTIKKKKKSLGSAREKAKFEIDGFHVTEKEKLPDKKLAIAGSKNQEGKHEIEIDG